MHAYMLPPESILSLSLLLLWGWSLHQHMCIFIIYCISFKKKRKDININIMIMGGGGGGLICPCLLILSLRYMSRRLLHHCWTHIHVPHTHHSTVKWGARPVPLLDSYSCFRTFIGWVRRRRWMPNYMMNLSKLYTKFLLSIDFEKLLYNNMVCLHFQWIIQIHDFMGLIKFWVN